MRVYFVAHIIICGHFLLSILAIGLSTAFRCLSYGCSAAHFLWDDGKSSFLLSSDLVTLWGNYDDDCSVCFVGFNFASHFIHRLTMTTIQIYGMWIREHGTLQLRLPPPPPPPPPLSRSRHLSCPKITESPARMHVLRRFPAVTIRLFYSTRHSNQVWMIILMIILWFLRFGLRPTTLQFRLARSVASRV